MNVKQIGAAVLLGAMVVGCGGETQPAADEMAIKVNGKELMQSSIDADVEAMIKAQGDKIPADQQEYARQMIGNQIVQSFIIENVLVAKANAEGFKVTDADRKAREEEFLKAVAKMPDAPKSVDEYFQKFPLGAERARAEFENGILIDKMIKAYQAKNPAKDYAAEAKKIIANIVSNNATAATAEKDALKKLKGFKAELDKLPADQLAARFAELAKANSDCPSSQKGGDLGAFARGQMVKEFDECAFKLPVGKVSPPVKTQFGYHLILVTKKIPAVEAKGDQPAEPEKVQASHILIKAGAAQEVPTPEKVIEFLKKQGDRTFVQEFVQNLVKSAKLEASEKYKQFLPPEPPKAKGDAVECQDGACEVKPQPVEKAEKK